MRRRYGFKRLILIMGLLPVLLISVGFSAYLTQQQLADSRELLTQRAKSAAQQLSVVSSHMMQDHHEDTLAYILHTALEEPGVRAVSIYNSDLELISHAGPGTPPPNVEGLSRFMPFKVMDQADDLQITWAIHAPLSAEGHQTDADGHLGWVQMSYGWHQYELMKYQSYLAAAIFLGLSVLVCILFFSYINHNIGRDLQILRMATHRLTSGQRDLHIHVPGGDEFSELAEDLNELNAAQVRELKELQLNLEQSNSDLRETLETLEIQNIELDLARREAVTASRVKSEFLANTSHEIRTPLNSILGFSNILLKADIRGRQREAVETIRNSAVNLLTIINDILDFSKLEAGKLVFDKAPVQLRELAEDTLIMLAPGAAEKRLDLALFVEKDTPEAILSDSLRLRQMLTNLVSNAIKFTPTGTVRVDISCSERDDDYATLTFKVTDSGIGMSAEQRKHIFRDFGQGDASVTRQYGGTGLGLVIVQGLVKEMGGEIGVESELGHGSTFWFSLRLAIDHNAMQMRDFQSLQGSTVALYDSSPLYGLAICDLLEGWGMNVQLCQGIDDINTQADHCILSLDAEESCQPLPTIHRDGACVVLSYHSEEHPQDNNVWLSKPVSHVRLFDALNTGLSDDNQLNNRHFRNSQVLIVDDNPSNLLILSTFLEDAGISPVSAQNGVEAVSHCQEQCFDLIFIDIQMPQLDGIAASRQIRQRGKNQHTPIVALSAYLAPENPSQLRDAGIDKYLSKPVNEQQLTNILQHYLAPSCDLPPTDEHAPEADADAEEQPRPVDLKQCLLLSKQRPTLAKNMLSMLLDELPGLRSQLTQAFDSKEWDTLTELNHGLKGNCCYTGVPLLKQAVCELEANLSAQKPPQQPLFTAVITRIDELLAWHEEHELDALFD